MRRGRCTSWSDSSRLRDSDKLFISRRLANGQDFLSPPSLFLRPATLSIYTCMYTRGTYTRNARARISLVPFAAPPAASSHLLALTQIRERANPLPVEDKETRKLRPSYRDADAHRVGASARNCNDLSFALFPLAVFRFLRVN